MHDPIETQTSNNPFDSLLSNYNPFSLSNFQPPLEIQQVQDQEKVIALLMESDTNPFSSKNLEKDNVLQKPEMVKNPTDVDIENVQAQNHDLKTTRDQIDNIAYALKPNHSLLEKIIDGWRNMSTGGQVAGCLLPTLPGLMMVAVKWKGLIYFSSAVAGGVTGVGAAVGVGFGVANYLIQDHLETNKSQDEKYQEHLRDLGDTLEIVKARLQSIYVDLALEMEVFRIENANLKSCNLKLITTNESLSQEVDGLKETSILLKQDRINLEAETEKLRLAGETHEESLATLATKLQTNQELMEINNQELAKKNETLKKLNEDLAKQQTQSKNTIDSLKLALQRIVQTTVQNDTNSSIIMQKLDNCVVDFQSKLNHILDNMTMEYDRLQKAVDKTEQNNKDLDILLEEQKTKKVPVAAKEEITPPPVQSGFYNTFCTMFYRKKDVASTVAPITNGNLL